VKALRLTTVASLKKAVRRDCVFADRGEGTLQRTKGKENKYVIKKGLDLSNNLISKKEKKKKKKKNSKIYKFFEVYQV